MQEIEGETLIVIDSKGIVSRVSLAAIGCEELLRRQSDLRADVGTPIARSYAALLAGRKAWMKELSASNPEEQALKADGERTAAILDSGRAAQQIEALSKAPLPATAAAGESLLEHIRSLRADSGREPLVIARAGTLRQLAAWALAPQFETKGLAALGIHGTAKSLGDGKVRIRWSFDHAEERDDFVEAPFPPSESWRDGLVTTEKESFARIGGGQLKARGARFWRSKLAFDAPMSVIVNERYEDPHVADDAPFPFSALGVTLCDDGADSRIVTVNMAGIRVRDRGSFEQDNEPTSYDLETDYEVRVDHDGKRATIRSPGFVERSVPVLGRSSGYVGLVTWTDMTVDVLDLTVEARLAPQSLLPLRDAWLETELAGFDAAIAPKH